VMNLPVSLGFYKSLEARMAKLPEREWMHTARLLASEDLYFLLRYILSTRSWVNPEDPTKSFWDHPWLLDRCREVQFDSDRVLDIWARFHCKSTIKTFAESIRRILKNPNLTVGIFSVTKSVADEFVGQIKFELESNELLRGLFPDVLYWEPQKESQRWTLEKGFVVKRNMNLKDATVRGFGLLDTSFTGHRIAYAVYDDAVNESNVTTPDMVDKTTKKWELSLATGMPGSTESYIGTFYAHGDTYHDIAGRGIRLRLHPCFEIDYKKSTFDPDTGLPLKLVHDRSKGGVLFSQEYLEALEKTMGTGTFGIQLLCDSNAGVATGFKLEWLKYYGQDPYDLRPHVNTIITVDPAGEKKKHSSSTAMWVWGLGKDKNYYILDGVVDKLNLAERTDKLFELVERWEPDDVRYEKYSFQGDIEHIRYVQDRRNFRFNVTEVGGSLSKDDRIERLIPLFSSGRVYLPEHIFYYNSEAQHVDLIDQWVKSEYLTFPNTQHKDGLDSMSRIAEPDMQMPWPRRTDYGKRSDAWRRELHKNSTAAPGTTWMSQ